MRRRSLIALLFLVLCPLAQATAYYLAPATGTTYHGSDSNNGTSATTPWLTPNHSVNCGDTLTAVAGTYASTSFSYDWGTVTCPAGNNVAWVQCATAFACSITDGANPVAIDANYWGIQGFVVTTSTSGKPCFLASPFYSSPTANVHHIIFANDIANGCQAGGFNIDNSGSYSADYVAFIGDIAYNAAQESAQCTSGFDVFEPAATDSNSGTHIYIAGSFAWANVNPSTCYGTAPTDGEGAILDTLTAFSYSQQIVVRNNIFVGNGGRCITVFSNNGASYAPVYVEKNTCWGNNTSTTSDTGALPEIWVYNAYGVTVLNDIAVTNRATGSSGNTLYAYGQTSGNSTNTWTYLDAYSASGSYFTGITAGTGAVTTNPSLSISSVPSAPSCGSYSTTTACMASLITSVSTSVSGLTTYGYQTPSNTSISDALYPAWLCNVSIPNGLDTPGCGAVATSPSGITGGSLTGGSIL